MTIVFKYGGHAISDSVKVDPTIKIISDMVKNGQKVVVVHGGGPQINRELEIHGVSSQMVNGYRKTTPEVMDVVQRTLSGEVLRNLVNQFTACGVKCVGISAADGKLFEARIKDPDLGLVGDIVSTNPHLLQTLLDAGYLPVISPVGVSTNGQALNLNADTVAGAIAGALSAKCVYFATDVSGIYRSWPDENSLIKEITSSELRELLPLFSDGMIPKVQALLNAVESGARSACVFDGRDSEIVSLALSGHSGTLVKK